MQVQNINAYSIGNSLIPQEGPQAFSTVLRFAATSDGFQFDQLAMPQVAQKISMVQTLYVDASYTDNDIIITVGKSGQSIIVKGRTQGYYPVVAPNAWMFDIQCADAFGVVPISLLNYQVAPGNWAATHP